MGIDIETIKTNMNTYIDTYQKQTHELSNYNEIYSVNFYLQNMNTLEADRLERANNNIKAKVLKMKQEYMLMDYGVHENKMRANIMFTTLVIASIVSILLVMFVKDQIAQNNLIMYIVGIFVVYFGIVIFILMSNSKRRKYAWDQYYWSQMKKAQ